MKTAIILTSISILCIFGIAILYPMYRNSVKKRKLQAWRSQLEIYDYAYTVLGEMCLIITEPDVNGDCKIKLGLGIHYTNIDKLYPQGGENGKGS